MADAAPAFDPFAAAGWAPPPTNDNTVRPGLSPVIDIAPSGTPNINPAAVPGQPGSGFAPSLVGGAPTINPAPVVVSPETQRANFQDTMNNLLGDPLAPRTDVTPPVTAPIAPTPKEAPKGEAFDPFKAAGWSVPAAPPAAAAPIVPNVAPAAPSVASATGQPKQTGMLANIGAGTSEAVSGLLGLPVDTAAMAMNLGLKQLGMKPIENPFGGAKTWNQLFGLVGANPENVAPTTEGQQLARAAARAATGVALPAGVASRLVEAAAPAAAVNPALQTLAAGAGAGGAAAGAAGGVTGELAREAAPEPYKSAAELVGNVVGGGVAGAAGNAATAVGRTAASVLRPASQIDRLAGRILTEQTGGQVPYFEAAPTPNVPLNIAQASGNPELASLVDVRNAANVPALKREVDLQNQGLVSAVPRSPTALSPEAEATRASTAATSAVQEAARLSNVEEKRVWNKPTLGEPRLSSSSPKQYVADMVDDLRRNEAGLALAIDESGALKRTLSELTGMPDKVAANQINAISSRFRKIARAPAESPDVRLVATRLANATQEGIWNAPEVAGRPAQTAPAVTETHVLPDGTTEQVQIGARTTPEIKPDPELTRDLRAARAFTKEEAQTIGHASFDNILRRNSYGNETVVPGTALNRFFDFASGSERPGDIKDLSRFLDDIRSEWIKTGNLGEKYDPDTIAAVRADLEKNAKDFIASKFLSAVSGAAEDMSGTRIMAAAKTAKWLETNRGLLQRTGLYTGPQIDAWNDMLTTARMVARGNELGRPVGSPTYSRLMGNRWLDVFMSPLTHFVASSALGGVIGGTLGHFVGEGALGAILGMEGGGVGSVLLQRLYAAPKEMVLQRLDEAIRNPAIAKDLMMQASARASFSPATRAWMRGFLAALPNAPQGQPQGGLQ